MNICPITAKNVVINGKTPLKTYVPWHLSLRLSSYVFSFVPSLLPLLCPFQPNSPLYFPLCLSRFFFSLCPYPSIMCLLPLSSVSFPVSLVLCISPVSPLVFPLFSLSCLSPFVSPRPLLSPFLFVFPLYVFPLSLLLSPHLSLSLYKIESVTILHDYHDDRNCHLYLSVSDNLTLQKPKTHFTLTLLYSTYKCRVSLWVVRLTQ